MREIENYFSPCILLCAKTVFFMRKATVSGHTPPGTGVIAQPFASSFSVSQSPKSLLSTTEKPTSMITASFFTIYSFIKWITPAAAIIISACSVIASRSGVLLLQLMTVAPALMSRFVTGFPTILLLPITQIIFPEREIFFSEKICIIPAGVQGSSADVSPMTIFPWLIGWKPSTSFSGAICSMIFFAWKCFGRGSCTMKPETELSVFRVVISERSSSSVMVRGNFFSSKSIPIFSAVFFLCLIYLRLSWLFHTSIATSFGVPSVSLISLRRVLWIFSASCVQSISIFFVF